ncbi:hypothetical protein ACWIGW_40845 [Nocardia brasiliensis]
MEVAIVTMMGWNGIGRFRRPGDSKPGESVIERDIFAILNFVLGDGTRNYKVGGRYELRADMMFPIGERHDYRLVVEYDGEYWHGDDEDTDLNKIVRTLHDHGPHYIMRLREQPLRRLWPADVSVPRRADAMTCAQLALLHLAHRPEPYEVDPYRMARIHEFLAFGAVELPDNQIHCDFCLELNYVLQVDRPVLDRSAYDIFPGSSPFTDAATRLAQKSGRIEYAWHPSDRGWEDVETVAYRRHRFRRWLEKHRAINKQSEQQPTEVDSTIPLFDIAQEE